MPEQAKRTRRKIGYQVQSCARPSAAGNPLWLDDGQAHETQADARRWIRASGVEGNSYQIVRVVFGPVTVKVQNTPKRTLE